MMRVEALMQLQRLLSRSKMLGLEACLAGRALETIKDVGYSKTASEAAKWKILKK